MIPLLRWVDVDLRAVAHNVRGVRRLLGSSVRFTAVVKADGYGHGAIAIGKTVLKHGADDLAVTYLEEAVALRQAGVRVPILVMGPVDPSAADTVARNNLTVMVDHTRLLTALDRAPKKVNVHLEVDMGLRRWGVPLEKAEGMARCVKNTAGVRLAEIYSHPGYVPGKNGPAVKKRIIDGMAYLRKVGLAHVPFHVANSAILIDFPQFRFGRVRVGNFIYGINLTEKRIPLKNPWQAWAKIVRVFRVKAGTSVGYGDGFTASKAMILGAVPVGYVHGVTLEPVLARARRELPPTFYGWVAGKKCPFVGGVGMTHCVVDLSSVPSPHEGMSIALPLRRTAGGLWPKVYLS